MWVSRLLACGSSPEPAPRHRKGIWRNSRNRAYSKFLVVGAPPPTGSALIGSYSGQSGHAPSPETAHQWLAPPSTFLFQHLSFSAFSRPPAIKVGVWDFTTVQFGTQCVPNWKKWVERIHITLITLIQTGTQLGGQPLSHQRQQSCAILGPRPASSLELDQVPFHFPVGACTPSQTPTQLTAAARDTCGCLASPHAELGLSAPGNTEPQLGAHASCRHPL